jgi:3-oxoacyl-[acyl-carrier-protein] synthase II
VTRAEVLVTGAGLVTPLGATAAESAAAWRAGAAAPRRTLPELAGTALESAAVAALPEFDAAARLGGRRMLKYMSEAALLGCLAAHEAAGQAGLSERFDPRRVGLYAAAGLAAAALAEVLPMIQASIGADGRVSTRLLGERGLPAANPLLSFKTLANMPACLVSIIEGVRGPSCICTPWEGQAGAALLEAWRAVAAGEVDCALCGAADTAAHPATFVYLRGAGLLGADEFPASAAGYLVLERAETARRDARPELARIAHMELAPVDTGPHDPLAARMGRSFAAAPAVLLALAGLVPGLEVRIAGADGQEFRAELEAAA